MDFDHSVHSVFTMEASRSNLIKLYYYPLLPFLCSNQYFIIYFIVNSTLVHICLVDFNAYKFDS